MKSCAAAVIGLGVMGSAALYNLRKRGIDAIGFDPLPAGDRRGSSHGSCRVYRRYNSENPAYTELAAKAYDAWRALERVSGRTILIDCPVLEACVPSSSMVRDSRAAAPGPIAGPTHGGDVQSRFPSFHLPADWEVVVHEEGGILLAQEAIAAFRAGVEPERVFQQRASFERCADHVLVKAGNEIWRAQRIIICAGPWVTQAVPALADNIAVTRQVVGWFKPLQGAAVDQDRFPIFILEDETRMVYGFPDFESRGVKAGSHHNGRVIDPDLSVPDADISDLSDTQSVLADYTNAFGGTPELLESEVCLYTNTINDGPDEEFIIDWLPGDKQVIVASPCSGHGFKFASAIGEMLTDMIVGDAPAPPQFALSRFPEFLARYRTDR